MDSKETLSINTADIQPSMLKEAVEEVCEKLGESVKDITVERAVSAFSFPA